MENDLNVKIKIATKWSAAGEILAKVVNPIISLVLARLLAPEAFGIVATLTMVISFAEIFTDAGFQKYLIQHKFNNKADQEVAANVAFWSNLTLSFVIWGLIALFDDSIAILVGNPGLGYVLTIACVSIPLEAFSSIQRALYKRALDFKTLFKVRLVSIIVPLVITIPLTLILRNFWALVIATIVMNVANAIILTIHSNWKPRLFYSYEVLKEMLSFTIWTVFESVSIWLTCYVDIFVIGKVLNQYYLGLYKTGSTITGQIMGIVTATTTPIIFSSLSQLQDNHQEFETLFLRFQKYVGMLLIPIGVGIYCYSDLITFLLLGEQWIEASGFIGLWGITSAFTIIFAQYAGEAYRAKGRPKLSVLGQWLHIIVLYPVVWISAKYSFEVLYTARSLVRFEYIFVQIIILNFAIHLSAKKMLINIFPACLASVVMFFSAYFLKMVGESILWSFVSIAICIIVYFCVLLFFRDERILFNNKIRNRFLKR